MVEELQNRVDEIARTPVLLVATDFDGTLAPIVSEPDLAEAHREAMVALKALAAMPQTHVAVVSGRALSDLARRIGDAEGAHLVGSHGSEFEAGLAVPLPRESMELLAKVEAQARLIASRTPGAKVECKPASVAFHYRNVAEPAGQEAARDLIRAVDGWPGLHVRHGKKVVELSVVKTDKGHAIQSLRQRLGATAVVFLGDDVTDEDALATLVGPDLGVKVGDGPTVARFRVGDTLEVVRLLARITERRAAWLAGSEAVPIERHSLLSDQRTCALVTPECRVCWLCAPRLDSAGLFSELLGGPAAGFFEIRPADDNLPSRQHYLDSSFVLCTDWGPVRVIDYMDCSGGRPFQRAGRTDLLRVIEGRGPVRITFAPRLNFSALETRLVASDSGIVVQGAVDPCGLFAPGIRWTIRHEGRHDTATALIELNGDPVVLELRYGTASLAPSRIPESQRRQQTQRFWSVWAATLDLPELYRQQVLRSALVLRALCYGPTGAIAAAATTSLPEHAGGVRNWDYRFCWPRDAAMAASSLVRLGATGPAMKLLDWVLGILEDAEPGSLMRPLYTVTGGHLGTEGVIAELSGYRGSRPVRVGNDAAHQVQLDVLGPIAELLALMAERGASLTPEHWRLLESMVQAVDTRWTEADHGIWEIRGPRRHHVHSKVMCWQTASCALKVAEYMGHRRPEWARLKDAIAADVLSRGWKEHRKSFSSSYETDDIDAATLWVGLSGLLTPDDPRFAATAAAVERELREGPTVYRYRFDDSLPGIEGGFNICTSWLIESYALLGRWQEAEDLLASYVALAGPTGLMAEEFDPVAGEALGNFPQAYSHLGLINAVLRVAAKAKRFGSL